MEDLAKDVKRVLRWGNGLAIFVTKECRKLKWKEGTFIQSTVDRKNGTILFKKIELK